MTDIVERLRAFPVGDGRGGLFHDAADEIERLRERVASLQASSGYESAIAQLEIERLTATLRECGADWKSEPGTVMGTAGQVAREFKRRMQIAADVLEPKP